MYLIKCIQAGLPGRGERVVEEGLAVKGLPTKKVAEIPDGYLNQLYRTTGSEPGGGGRHRVVEEGLAVKGLLTEKGSIYSQWLP